MPRIVRVELGRFDYAVAGEFKFFKPGPDGHVRRPSILVRLTDETGETGWGQAVPVPTWTYETVETVTTTLEHHLAPVLLGLDAADFAAIHARLHAAIRPAFSVGQPLAKAAVDLACHDLVGRRRGIPAHHLWAPLTGPALPALTLSWTVASPDPAVIERQLEEGRARGYRNFNIKIGYPQDAAYDLALARRVRAFAPGGFLWADANTGLTPDEALALAPRLADAGVDVLESPLPPNQLRGYQALKKQGALPLFMDEGILSPVEAEEFAALGMMDGIAMKPARNAGLFPSVEIIRRLHTRGLRVLGSGLTDPDYSLAASLHLYAWAGLATPCALNGPQFLAEQLDPTATTPTADKIAVPTAPGLGLTPAPRALASLRTVAEA
jgi:L-alanine-DL-glutamate epimerase-like enolase superfamily enzyme